MKTMGNVFIKHIQDVAPDQEESLERQTRKKAEFCVKVDGGYIWYIKLMFTVFFVNVLSYTE